MAQMYFSAESPRIYFGYISQLTKWILDSGMACHMKPYISDFIPGSLVEMDKYIEFADGIFFTEKQTGEFQINMHDDNGKTFIATYIM